MITQISLMHIKEACFLQLSREFPVCLCLPWCQSADSRQICLSCGRQVSARATRLLLQHHTSSVPRGRKIGKLTNMDAFPSDSLEHLLLNSLSKKCSDFSEITPCLGDYLQCVRSCKETNDTKLRTTKNGINDQLFDQFLLKEKVLLKYAQLLDIVDDSSRRSCCFTKGYGRLVEGTGSVLNPTNKTTLDRVFLELGTLRTNSDGNTMITESDTTVNVCSLSLLNGEDESSLQVAPQNTTETSTKHSEIFAQDVVTSSSLLMSLGLRYFTPDEALSLMGFPDTFHFPDTLTQRQQFQLVGNSVNVLVVSVLMSMLFDTTL